MQPTKISQLKQAAARGDWATALRIAAKFPQLGAHAAAIKRAHEASHSAAFYRQIGRDPDELIRAGIQALRERYNI